MWPAGVHLVLVSKVTGTGAGIVKPTQWIIESRGKHLGYHCQNIHFLCGYHSACTTNSYTMVS